jgi:outer membrane protein
MKTKLIIIIVLLLTANSMDAQPRAMTIEDAIATGMENSRMLHASQMKAEFAGARSSEIGASLYPSVKAQMNYQRLSDVPAFTIPIPFSPVTFPVILNNYMMKATLQQPLFTGWKLQSAADNAEYSASAARSDFDKDKEELLYNIKSAYWNVYRAREVKRLADENVKQISQHLADIESMYTQGLVTNNEVLKTKVQLSNSRLMQSDGENNVRIAVIAFNSTIGLPLTTDIVVSSSLTPTTKEYPEVERLLSQAMNQRSDVHSSEWRLKATEAGITAATAGWFPQIFLTGNYYYSRPNQRIFPAQDEFKDTWDVGVSLQFDIWNNLTTAHQTVQAKAQFEQAKDAFAILKDGITLEVTQSYLNFRQAKQRIELARLSVEQADENLRVTKEKFKAGLTTNSEMLDAEVVQHQAKLQLVQAYVEHELAEAKLTKSIGKTD